MKHYDEGIIQLIQLYLTGDLSEEEKIKLEEWIRRDIARERLLKEICEEGNIARDLDVYGRVDERVAWEKVVWRGNIRSRYSSRRWGWYRCFP